MVLVKMRTLLLLLGVASVLSAEYDWYAPRPTRYFSLTISSTTLWTDCNPSPNSVVINGTSPAPILRARAGERLLINVTNTLPHDNTTIHWHGLSMYLNPASDGTSMIAQWPIAYQRWMVYDIRLPDHESGTYFYHSHVGLQSMSAFGALVIEDKSTEEVDLKGKSTKGAPYEYDEDRIMALGDYFAFKSEKQIAQGLDADPFVWPGSAHALTLNGKQKGECNKTAVAAMTPPETCQTKPSCGYEEIHIQPGKTYRLRFIGAQALHYTSIKIMDHKLKIIEADGSYLESLEVENIEVAPGQRYSALLTAKSKEEVGRSGGVYWIRMESRYRAGPGGWAKLVYDDARGDTPPDGVGPTTRLLPNETYAWVTPKLAPLASHTEPCPPDSVVTRTVLLDAQQISYFNSKKGVRWAQNGDLYDEVTETNTPYLISILRGSKEKPSYTRAFRKHDYSLVTKQDRKAAKKHKLQQGYDEKTDLYLAKAGEILDIIIVNRPSNISNSTEFHPWHFHSVKHWTITCQPGTFSFARYEEVLKRKDGFRNPIPRDTTGVYPTGASYLNQTVADPQHNDGGWSVLRYKVQKGNAGLFPLHCHLAFHLKMGMAVVWGLAIDDINEKVPKEYLKFGQNVPAIA